MDVWVVSNAQRVVGASGEIDLSNVDRLRAALDDAVRESPGGFVIDLSGAAYIDSAGLQVILNAYRQVHACGGKIAAVLVDGSVRDIMNIISIERFPGFIVRETIEAAEGALSAAS